ncbi:hypothetical protein H2248_012563 [Termitomyces sp. 'cryptogamus']|nr:hypothetical protein H2248_012563 [Termitomyces sp. 'cryptogamus']
MQDDHPLVLSRPAVQLSPEQQQVLDKVRSGHSVFFTGSAGTGKSVLLREIIDTLKERGDTLGITASTGIAAVNIGGSTLHSWAGIGLGDQPAKRYIGKFFGNEQSRKILDRWKNVDTLIIDEVSMIDGSLFDKLEHIAREVRYNDHPFGGIQLVLSGDFCQLPPVSGRDKQGRQISPVFAFDANTWDACVGSPVILTRVFRQKDQHFIDMLNAMRFGQINDKSAFTALSRKVEYADGIEPTELYGTSFHIVRAFLAPFSFSTRSEVDNANTFRLGQLKTEARIYTANDIPGTDSNGVRVTPVQMARLLERLVVPKKIHLKVGAQVMLIKNLVQGELVNGSVGQIVRFVTAQDAVSECAHIPGADRAGGKPQLPQDDLAWPVVRFIGRQETVIIPQEFTVNNAEGGVEARRDQVPLILSWALSVHKSQGQTLERVKVDLKRTFEKGQAYVALSRATRMDQLQVLNFDVSKVVAHPRVLEWYSKAHPPRAPDDEVIELSDSDDITVDKVHRTSASTRTEVIDLTKSDNQEDEEVAMSWYHEVR